MQFACKSSKPVVGHQYAPTHTHTLLVLKRSRSEWIMQKVEDKINDTEASALQPGSEVNME